MLPTNDIKLRLSSEIFWLLSSQDIYFSVNETMTKMVYAVRYSVG
jgi:hypothetical protein